MMMKTVCYLSEKVVVFLETFFFVFVLETGGKLPLYLYYSNYTQKL